MSGRAVLTTERLILRGWGEGDDEAFARHLNTPAVMRWLGGLLSPERLAEATARYRRWEAERGYTFWIAERRDDAEWLGFCGLKHADTPGSPILGELEIGWRFREDAWGRGYAREAAEASLGYAFDRLPSPRVVAITVPGNVPSWTLMQRLGMRHLPELDYADTRFGPELTPAIVHAVTRSEWEARAE